MTQSAFTSSYFGDTIAFSHIIGFTSLESFCVSLLFSCPWMLPTSFSSWLSSWSSWGSVRAEYRPWWWRYRWGSSRAVMFLIESSMWGRLWPDKFTCRDKEKRSVLKRFTQLDEARTIRTTGQFYVTCCCRTFKETSQDSICCSTSSNLTVGNDHRVEFTVHKHELFFFGPCPRRPLLSTFSYTHVIFKDGKILYWCLYLHMVASSIK